MIGEKCKLYRKCKVCKGTKWYQEFSLKGKGKRKTYCKRCKSKRHTLKLPQTAYSMNTETLEKGEIKVRLKLNSNRKIEYTVPHEQAVLMIDEGIAGIVHETLIHKFYDRKSFKKAILKKYNYTCCYCGNFGDTVDHIKAKSQGGISGFKNCICACRSCNRSKDDLSIEDFINYMEPYPDNIEKSTRRLFQQFQYSINLLNMEEEQEIKNSEDNDNTKDLINLIEKTEKILKMYKVKKLSRL
ncbi:HNH endonuclease [Halobacillus sp. B29]|uniref:HNH endonuclease n=1 Tax=Halobacillus sp. B29 TaxID=3457432 RepID=UPI003FCDE4A4